jgi:protein gp37
MNKIYKRSGIIPSPPHLVESELRTNLGKDNFIFVGSSIDMFAEDIPLTWIERVIACAMEASKSNTFLFHTKNPEVRIRLPVLKNFILCTTIESDRTYEEMGKAPSIESRFVGLHTYKGRKMITIEPIMDFDIFWLVDIIKYCNVEQVNIGADTGHNNLPEPPKEQIIDLITELQKFTTVVQKKNLRRVIA